MVLKVYSNCGGHTVKRMMIFIAILSILIPLSVSAGDNRGTNSGGLIRSRHPQFGFEPVSHRRQNIAVRNMVRITYKSKPGHTSYFQVYYWKYGRKVLLRAPG